MNERIILLALKGDHDAFRALVDSYKDFVYGIAYRYVLNREDAEDITQTVFIKIWNSRKKIKEPEKFSTYLYRTVVNVCLNFKRKRKMEVELNENIYGDEGPHRAHQVAEKKRRLIKSLMKLKKEERIALLLHVVGEKSHTEIAEIMKRSRKSVESLIYRARKKLRKFMEE